MFCPDCGSEVAEGRKFCGKCGGQLHAASGSVDTEQSIPESPEGAVAQVLKPPLSTRTKLTYALVALLVVLGGVAWWWFHRPAPAFRAEDPGIYPFQDQGKWGFIDAQGNILIQPRLEQVVPSLIQGQWVFFNEGLCEIKANGKWGYIDKGGSFAIPAQFDQARPFVGGVAAVALGNQWGFIDKSGHYVVNPQFESASDFHDGLAPAQKDGKWGFIDKSGMFVIPAKFGAANPGGFVDGLAGVQIDQRVGYIDRSGKLAISTTFQEIDDFSEGLARVRLGNRWGYIDTGGKIVVNPQFDQAFGFSGGRAVVSVAGHWATIDRTGKFILNPGQYNVLGFAGNLLAVNTADGLGFMTRDGKWILQPSKAINGFWWPVIGNVLYASPTTQGVTPISTSGKVLAGWYKGAMLDTLAPDIQNETSAIQSMRILTGAQASYSGAYPATGFTASIDKLRPATGAPDENHAGLIDAALATGTKDNYQFTVSIPEGTSTGGANFNYFIVAKPAAGHAGRTFCADSSATVRYSIQGQECTATSPAL